VKIGQPWRPVGMAKKRKKGKSQTVIFHACAETTPTARSLPYLEVKVAPPDVVAHPKFHGDQFMGFAPKGSWKSHFSYT